MFLLHVVSHHVCTLKTNIRDERVCNMETSGIMPIPI